MISLQTGHIKKSDRERREAEEALLRASDGTDLDSVKASMFVNATARKEYQRALRRLREEGQIIGNLNRADLISYANSFGRYMDLVKMCRAPDFKYTVNTETGLKANPLVRMLDETRRDMAESSRRLGMTLDGQLKTAKAKTDQLEADMRASFGDI